MSKYKLLKDLPGYPAGTVFEVNGSSVWYESQAIQNNLLVRDLENYPDWFEPIEENKRWRASLTEPEDYFYVNFNGLVRATVDAGIDSDNKRYEVGNYFRTREQAEAVAEAIRAVLEYIHTGSNKDFTTESHTYKLLQARKAVQEGEK